jgi:hypothetical protein
MRIFLVIENAFAVIWGDFALRPACALKVNTIFVGASSYKVAPSSGIRATPRGGIEVPTQLSSLEAIRGSIPYDYLILCLLYKSNAITLDA